MCVRESYQINILRLKQQISTYLSPLVRPLFTILIFKVSVKWIRENYIQLGERGLIINFISIFFRVTCERVHDEMKSANLANLHYYYSILYLPSLNKS